MFIAAMGPKMMRLAARHADIWGVPVLSNTPEGYSKFERVLRAACTEVGRDPNSLVKMAIVGFDPFSRTTPASNPYGESLSGSPPKVASALRRFSEAGYGHIMLMPYPNTLEAVQACAPVLEEFKRSR